MLLWRWTLNRQRGEKLRKLEKQVGRQNMVMIDWHRNVRWKYILSIWNGFYDQLFLLFLKNISFFF